MASKKIHPLLTKKTTYYEIVDSLDGKTQYLMKHHVWSGWMWVYHLLRKTALFFDSLGDLIRKIIFKYEIDLSPKFEEYGGISRKTYGWYKVPKNRTVKKGELLTIPTMKKLYKKAKHAK